MWFGHCIWWYYGGCLHTRIKILKEKQMRAPYQGIKKNAMENIVREISKKAGIEKRVFPHLLRHTFATHALNKGMPLESLSDLMGHACIETTRIYAKNHMSKIRYEYDMYAS